MIERTRVDMSHFHRSLVCGKPRMACYMKTKAIIFDLDGTLLESMHLWMSPDFNGNLEHDYKNKVILKPGVYDFLQSLQQNGVRMVIATATDRHMVIPALQRNKIDGFFEKVFTCREVGSSKDTPTIYFSALKFLGLEKEDVWVFEDAGYAIATAKSAGFKVAVIDDKWAYLPDKIKSLADLYIEDYGNIAGILKRLG